MSIEDEIKDRVARGMLYPLIPKAAGTSPRRALFVSEELWNVLTSPIGTDEWEQRVGELQADLEMFSDGQPIDPKFLFLLAPAFQAVWEIRSVREQPSIRVACQFAEYDILIALLYALRGDLDGWESRGWKEFKRAALAKWRALFDPYQPVKTTDVNQVVSGALDGRYFK